MRTTSDNSDPQLSTQNQTNVNRTRVSGTRQSFPRAMDRGSVSCLLRLELQQIPFVPVEIFKHCDRAVTFLARIPDEANAARFQGGVIAREIVRVQEQKHATAGLVADAAF